MFVIRSVHPSICVACRLRASIVTKQLARCKQKGLKQPARFLSSSQRLWQDNTDPPTRDKRIEEHGNSIAEAVRRGRPEDAALRARQLFGDALPEGHLSDEEYRVYERLYGQPLRYGEQTELLQEEESGEEVETGTGVLIEGDDGTLEEVAFDVDEADDVEGEEAEATLLDDEFEDSEADARLNDDIRASRSNEFAEYAEELQRDEDSSQKAHPLTLLTRFTTSPSTLPLPQSSVVDPIEAQVSAISNTHLSQAAHRLFGGVGLPYSTSTPNFGKTMQQKPIPLDASQSQMSEIEGDVFLSTVFPGVYASVTSILTETRKRLGTAWAEGLVQKADKGELRVLDAGGGGAGVLAVREMLRAEWERMHEEDPILSSSMAVAEADGRVGGSSATPPLGHATVLTGSDVLRRAASKVLENTTFVPRLPDYVHTTDAKGKGKFDLVIAPHTLWGLREDWTRKAHVQNLWSLLKRDGGVLLLLEKGVARGFEVVAAARQLLLETYTQSATSTQDHDGQLAGFRSTSEGKATILAPCPHHEACPMYKPQGMLKGRRDICHFSQRYVRPPSLQKILGAKDKNFEDVKFSYISVMRGQDLRQSQYESEIPPVLHGEAATAQAFAGFENFDIANSTPEQSRALASSLPRAILPPLKKKGHVILDLCTPSGTLERWTVPRSFSKQAFRDARKSSWGDLWALGAKTRVRRVPRGRKKRGVDDADGEGVPHADMNVKLVRKRVGVKGKAKKAENKRDRVKVTRDD